MSPVWVRSAFELNGRANCHAERPILVHPTPRIAG
jgi:hypothetical protein